MPTAPRLRLTCRPLLEDYKLTGVTLGHGLNGKVVQVRV